MCLPGKVRPLPATTGSTAGCKPHYFKPLHLKPGNFKQSGYVDSWLILSGFSFGIMLVLFLPPALSTFFPHNIGTLAAPAILSASVALLILFRKLVAGPVYLAAVSAVIGIVLVLVVSGLSARQQVPFEVPTDFAVTGHIDSIPEARGRKHQALFQIDEGNVCRHSTLPCRVLLSWYRDAEGDMPDLQPGQQWRLTLRAKPLRNYANPGSFDYAHWLAGKGIHATAYVRTGEPYELTGASRGGQVDLFRLRLAERIRGLLPASQERALVLGLAVGIRSEIDTKTRDLLQATGTAHLLAISGMHIGMVSGFAYLFARCLWWLLFLPAYSFAGRYQHSAVQQTVMRANRSFMAGFAALLAGFFYALAAGFSLPTQRALLMLAVIVFLRIKQRQVSLRHVLLVVLVMALLLDPLAPLYPGIWLSFGAVVALVWLGSGRIRKNTGSTDNAEAAAKTDENELTDENKSTASLSCLNTNLPMVKSRLAAIHLWLWEKVMRAGAIQLALSLVLFPLSIIFFQQGSLVSPVANFLAIPLVGFVVLPLIMSGLALGFVWQEAAAWILQLAEQGLTLMLVLLQWFNAWPFAAITFPETALAASAFAIAACLCVTKPRGGRLRWLALPLILPLLLQGVVVRQPGLRVHVLDVGQGLSVVVEAAGQVLLYDTGIGRTDKNGDGFSLVNNVVKPFLRSQGLPAPSVAVVSHSDNDHAGGLPALRKLYPQTRIIAPAAFQELRADEACEQGKHWRWNGVEFRLLYPAVADIRQQGLLSDNDLSCVLLVRYGRSTVLLPGDIEKYGESRLIDYLKTHAGSQLLRQQIDLVVAPHHGSATSSTPEFLEFLRPRYTVFSVGWANRYGFPDSSVVLRYKSLGTRTFRSDQSGAVRFDFGRGGLLRAPQEYRRQRWRVWSLWR